MVRRLFGPNTLPELVVTSCQFGIILRTTFSEIWIRYNEFLSHKCIKTKRPLFTISQTLVEPGEDTVITWTHFLYCWHFETEKHSLTCDFSAQWYGPSPWTETTLQCNVIFLWLSSYTKWSLAIISRILIVARGHEDAVMTWTLFSHYCPFETEKPWETCGFSDQRSIKIEVFNCVFRVIHQ